MRKWALIAGGVLLVAILAAVGASAWRAPVRVTGVSPADGSAPVPVTAPFRIDFSGAMDLASVRAHLLVSPAVSVTASLGAEGRSVLLAPAPAWAPSTAYTVTLAPGAAALGAAGRALGQASTWHFSPRAPRLLYLGWWQAPQGPVRELFLASPGCPEPCRLTLHGGVWDFAVSPVDGAVAYSVTREDGGADLWLMDVDAGTSRLILECPGAACLAPAWSPDGLTIAYERRPLLADGPNLDPQAGRIWLLDVARRGSLGRARVGKPRPLFDYDVPLHGPAWSPDPTGQRLAYVSPLVPAVEVLDLSSGALTTFPNEWGVAPAWSPAAISTSTLVAADLALVEQPQEAMVAHLFRYTLDGAAPADLSAAAAPGTEGGDTALLVKDGGPAWSPAGGWIAFTRQDGSAPGRQIWLMRPDGAEAYPLVVDPMADLFGPAWRPDGGALAYLSAPLDLAAAPYGGAAQPAVGVYIFDLTTRRATRVADGVMPRWLP